MAGTHEQVKKKQATALVTLKQMMRKRQLAECQKKTKQLQTQWIEQSTIRSESENEDIQQ